MGWALSFGVGTQAVSHWLTDLGHAKKVVGLVHAVYYLGVALASLAVPAWTRRIGMGCTLVGLVLSSVTLVLFPMTTNVWYWVVLRFLSGAGCAMCVVPLEVHIGQSSSPASRSRNFSYYAVALTVGGALGIWLGLEVYEAGSAGVFWLGAAPPVVSLVILQADVRTGMSGTEARAAPAPLGYRRNWLSFGTAWSQGFLEGGMLAFLALYLEGRGIERDTAGLLMGVTMVGVIAFQVPVAWLGDRLGTLPMLLVCYGFVLAGLCAAPLTTSLAWMGVWLFAFGAFAGAMYPLGLSLLGEWTAAEHLPRAYAVYLALECIGSQGGTAAMGWAWDAWGQGSIFGVGFVAVATVLASWLLVRRRTSDDFAVEAPMKRAA